MQGVFQVGFGLLSAHLTGGLGPWDVLIGTATERATKAILERAGGYTATWATAPPTAPLLLMQATPSCFSSF